MSRWPPLELGERVRLEGGLTSRLPTRARGEEGCASMAATRARGMRLLRSLASMASRQLEPSERRGLAGRPPLEPRVGLAGGLQDTNGGWQRI